MNDLVEIDSRTVRMRLILVAVIVFALIFIWFGVRWQFGNMFAQLTQAADPNASEIANLAVDWAPADPLTHSLVAKTSNDPFAAVTALEQSVRHAPFDYRWRIELGRAFEQTGEVDRAETEYKKAVELAPSYASTHWQLGNFLLRRERIDEAIVELKMAAANSESYRDQVFSLAWDYFNKDAFQVDKLVGDQPEARAHLAFFFAARGRADDALRNWNKLDPVDKSNNEVTAMSIARGLFGQRHYRQSLDFSKQYGGETEVSPEQVTNGSFEKNIGDPGVERFGWQIVRNDPKVEITVDNRVARNGERSLRMSFKGFNKPALANLFQTVVVDPNKKYTVRFWVRTENLKSSGGPMLEILNANDDTSIARSQTFSAGTNDWQEISVAFTTPDNCSGISVRTIRSFCGEDCPLSGIFWYDDFEVKVQ